MLQRGPAAEPPGRWSCASGTPSTLRQEPAATAKPEMGEKTAKRGPGGAEHQSTGVGKLLRLESIKFSWECAGARCLSGIKGLSWHSHTGPGCNSHPWTCSGPGWSRLGQWEVSLPVTGVALDGSFPPKPSWDSGTGSQNVHDRSTESCSSLCPERPRGAQPMGGVVLQVPSPVTPTAPAGAGAGHWQGFTPPNVPPELCGPSWGWHWGSCPFPRAGQQTLSRGLGWAGGFALHHRHVFHRATGKRNPVWGFGSSEISLNTTKTPQKHHKTLTLNQEALKEPLTKSVDTSPLSPGRSHPQCPASLTPAFQHSHTGGI